MFPYRLKIELWTRKTILGKTFDSSTGFELADGSMKSPDAASIKMEEWSHLTRKRFLPFAPNFVVEILSLTDRSTAAQQKMNKWIQNGSELGWLIDTVNKQCFIYRADGTVEKVEGFDKCLSGEGIMPGFEFKLSDLLDEVPKVNGKKDE